MYVGLLSLDERARCSQLWAPDGRQYSTGHRLSTPCMRVAVREDAMGEDAAGVVRQAVSLARWQGHAQVTPLHIARAMLSASPAGVFRDACVRSQSHPLQHAALEHFLEVALQRTAVVRPRWIHYGQQSGAHVMGDPVPSNAFIATLRRAQAHRHGGKVELEHLAVSVLDDPTVDRIMRAAGFSGSEVRACVENAVVSSEQAPRASCDVSTCPDPVSKKSRAGGQPSLQTVRAIIQTDVPQESEARAKFATAPPAFFDGTELVVTTGSLPPWLRRYQDTIPAPARSTHSRSDIHDTCMQAVLRRQKFTALTTENLKIICDALERRVPQHGHVVPGISGTVLRCRSGMTRRTARNKPSSSSSTWLLFRGRDGGGKSAVARELARLVFGSYTEFTTLKGNSDEPARSAGDELGLKRRRSPDDDGNGGDVGLVARLFEAIVENPHRVIMIDGVDRLDRDSETRIKNAIVGGTMMRGCNGDVVGLEDAIVVLSSGEYRSRSVVSASSPRGKRLQNREEGDAGEMEVRSRSRLSWDLNVCAVDREEEEDDSLADDDEGILDFVDGVFLFN